MWYGSNQKNLSQKQFKSKFKPKNKFDLTTLNWAIECKRYRIIKILLQDVRCNVYTGGGDKKSSLNFTLQISDYLAIVEILNSHKSIDFNVWNNNGINVISILHHKHSIQNSCRSFHLIEFQFGKFHDDISIYSLNIIVYAHTTSLSSKI